MRSKRTVTKAPDQDDLAGTCFCWDHGPLCPRYVPPPPGQPAPMTMLDLMNEVYPPPPPPSSLHSHLAENSGRSTYCAPTVADRSHQPHASAPIITTNGNHASRPLSNGTSETLRPVLQPLQSDMAEVSGSSSMNARLVERRSEPLNVSATMNTTIASHAPRPLDNDGLETRQPSPQSLQSNVTEGPGISSGQRAYIEVLNELLLRAETVLGNAVGLETPIAEVREIVTGAEGSTLQAGQHIQRLRQDLGAVNLQRPIVASPRLRLANSRVSRGQTGSRRTGSSRNRPPSGESSRASHLTLPARYRSGVTHIPADIVNDRALSTPRHQHALNRDENDDAALHSSVSTEHSLSVPASDPRAAGLGGQTIDVPPSFGLVDAMRNLDARIRSPVDSETGYPARSEGASASGEEEESIDDQ